MPYPNEHACRLREPGDFEPDSFRRTERDADGKPLHLITGKLKGETNTTLQAYRYPKDEWTASEAREHCREHKGAFEAAADSQSHTPARETMAARFSLADLDSEQGIVSGHASVFDTLIDTFVPTYIRKGAFAKTIKEQSDRIRMWYQHNPFEPIGVPVEIKEDEHGLFTRTKLAMAVERVRDVFELIRAGVLTDMSIGFDPIKETVNDEDDPQKMTRELHEVRLWEYSLVTLGANPEARITDLHSYSNIPTVHIAEPYMVIGGQAYTLTSDTSNMTVEAVATIEEPHTSGVLTEALDDRFRTAEVRLRAMRLRRMNQRKATR